MYYAYTILNDATTFIAIINTWNSSDSKTGNCRNKTEKALQVLT